MFQNKLWEDAIFHATCLMIRMPSRILNLKNLIFRLYKVIFQTQDFFHYATRIKRSSAWKFVEESTRLQELYKVPNIWITIGEIFTC